MHAQVGDHWHSDYHGYLDRYRRPDGEFIKWKGGATVDMW